MMVVTTSSPPQFAFRTPGIPAQIAPATTPPSRTSGRRIGVGRLLNLTPMNVQPTAPARNCPSAPMLNSPARNGSATATPAMSSGVRNTILFETWSSLFSPPLHRSPKQPQMRPWYAANGWPRVTATTTPPITNAKTTEPSGTAMPLAIRRRVACNPGRGRSGPVAVDAATGFPIASNGAEEAGAAARPPQLHYAGMSDGGVSAPDLILAKTASS